MKSHMNTSIDPCDDFYSYACGNWYQNTLPEDKTYVDRFSILQDQVDETLKNLLEELIENRNDNNENCENEDYNSAICKAAKFYKSCLNEELISKDEQKTFINFLEDNGCWPVLYPQWNDDDNEQFDWLTTVAKSSSFGVDVLIRLTISEDFEDSNSYKIYIIEPDVGMYRDNFLLESKSHILDGYKKMISQVLQLFGVNELSSKTTAEEIVKFETEIAKIIVDPNEAVSISDLSHLMTIDKLQIKYPLIDWQKFLYIATGGKFIDRMTKINLFESNYFKPFFKLIRRTKSKTIMNYVMWRITQTFLNTFDKRFKTIMEDFNDITLGKRQQKSRWKICIEDTRKKLGLALSALYVKKYFNDNSKNELMKFFDQLKNIFVNLLKYIEWMDWRTKTYAITKLNGMKIEVGYPKILKSEYNVNVRYKNLHISENYFQNTINVNQNDYARQASLLNSNVDKSEWDQQPIQINAAYDFSKNRISVNAAFLQLPIYYSKNFPKSLLYGGLGSFMGHEITHGFDETGSLFDIDGNKRNWWSNSSSETFQQKVQCMIEQYGNYTIQGHNVNGIVTSSENIADNGGIKESYFAYMENLSRQDASTENNLEQELQDLLQLSNKQIFFLQYAQMFCQKFKPEGLINYLESEIHAPGEVRVFGVLSNFNEFSKAYECPQGSKMNPEHRCEVW